MYIHDKYKISNVHSAINLHNPKSGEASHCATAHPLFLIIIKIEMR